jgi:hypothetical protein
MWNEPVSIAVVVGIVCSWGCSDDGPGRRPADIDGGQLVDAAGEDDGASPASSSSPSSFSRELPTLVAQTVPWSCTTVKVTGARLERGMDDAVRDIRQTCAELDVAITNHCDDDTNYQSRDTWDLLLANGSRLRPEAPLGLFIAPGDTATTTLRYLVDDAATLTGAALVLAGQERGALQEEIIPLDQPWSKRYPLRITTLAGTTLESKTDDTDDERVRYEITDALVGLDDVVEGHRAEHGQKLVTVDMIGTCVEGSYCTVSTDNLRLMIDGHAHEAENYHEEIVDHGNSQKLHARFSIPDEVSAFEIRFRLGYVGSQAIYDTVPVDLATDAKLVE